MNNEVIVSAGKIAPPVSCRSFATNNIAINAQGDIFLLKDDCSLYYSSLIKDYRKEQSPKEVFHRIQLIEDSQRKRNFNRLEFNQSGSMLLLWGEKSVGVVALSTCNPNAYEFTEPRCNPYDYEFTYIGDEFFEDPDSTLVQARWHPLGHYVVLLFKRGPIAIIDVNNGHTEEITLDSKLAFKSFYFGCNVDWMRFSIFLLTESGDIYVLCPIIPLGSIITQEIVEDLWDWLHELTSKESDGLEVELDQYLDSIATYLLAAFGPSKISTGDTDYATKCIIVGESAEHAAKNGSYGLHHTLQQSPALQGPLRRSQQSGNVKNSLTGHPSDVIMVSHYEDYVPVLAVAYSEGDVLVMLLYGEVRSDSFQ